MKDILLAFDTARSTDKNGFLHVSSSHITKACISPYRGDEIPGWREAGLKADQIYQAFRSPVELMKSLKSWVGLPLQMDHHAEGADEYGSRMTRVGTVGSNVEWDGTYINADLTVWNKEAIEAIEDGSCRELSCSYWYDPVFETGYFEGQRYDFVMTNIRGNHLALVPKGRAGHDVLVADSAIQTQTEVNNMFKKGKKAAMDADPTIEKREMELGQIVEKAGKKLQELHEINAEGDIVDKGESPNIEADEDIKDETASDSLDEIKAKYNLDDAAINEIKEALADIAKDEDVAEDEDEETASDEDEDKKSQASDEDEDDPIRDAIRACGLDADDPAMIKAFNAGIEYGEEGSQPKDKITSEEEAEVLVKKAEDRALRRLKSEISSKIKAVNHVAPVTGKLDPLTFDSAEAIYGYALRKAGVSITGIKTRDYKAVFNGFMAGSRPTTSRIKRASDAALKQYSFSKNLLNINIED